MSYQNLTLKARGLCTAPNALDGGVAPEGTMSEATNVVIDQDSIVNPRRGFKFYGDSFGTSSTRAKQLMVYKDRLLRHWSDELDADSNGLGSFSPLSDIGGGQAVVNEVNTGTRIKYIEANGNLYFTSSLGIRKLSTLTISDISTTPIRPAGGAVALDGQAALNTTSGWFVPDSVVAYRIVWGYKDQNNNVVLGVPSERIIIANSFQVQLVKSFNQLMLDLDAVASVPALVLSGKKNSNTSITNLPSTSQLSVGMLVSGTGIPANTAIVSIDDTTSITIDNAALDSATDNLSFGQVLSNTDYISRIISVNSSSAVLYAALKGLANGPTNPLDTDLSYPGHPSTTFGLIPVTPATEPNEPTPTGELLELQTYLDAIISALNLAEGISQYAKDTAISGAFASNASTASVTTNVTFTIPDAITQNDFYQVYRSALFISEGASLLSDLEPDDELRLVFEANPTAQELIDQTVNFFDDIPETFRDAGANLYTNQNSGEGISQANYAPPKALDIASFRQCAFFANTSTPYSLVINLLSGVDLSGGKVTISNETSSSTYTFIDEIAQETTIEPVSGANYATVGAADYFTISSTNNSLVAQVWFNTGSVTAPTTTGGQTNIECLVVGTETVSDMCTKITNLLNPLDEFIAQASSVDVIVVNEQPGYANAISESVSDISFAVTTNTAGAGEDAANLIVGIPQSPTPAQQVDGTARSFVRVINKNLVETVYAQYTSGVSDLPGKMSLTSKSFSNSKFYISANNTSVSQKFNPDFGTVSAITSISVANPTSITATAHGLTTGTQILISGSDSTPSIDGLQTITVVDANTFTIPVAVTIVGTTAGFITLSAAKASDNEVAPNRVYFSKIQQPEAVPIVNYLDVGPKNKAILRILPLRDGLFILSESGIYRLSGDSPSNFSVILADSSATIRAPDSAVVLNNQIYSFTTQGVSTLTDTGVSIISRFIENSLLPLTTSLYPLFDTATFAVAYESDRSYLLHTVTKTTDTSATVCYRYNTFTNSWVSWDISKSCGVINAKQDKLYYGPGDANSIEVERKTFTRLDHADREFERTVLAGGVDGTTLSLGSLLGTVPGDVFVQTQRLTVAQYNRLIYRLDQDLGLNQKNYNTLTTAAGANLRSAVTALANKLDTDIGLNTHGYAAAIVGYGSSFLETQQAFNVVVGMLIADANTRIKTYPYSTGSTEYEVPVSSVSGINIILVYPVPLIAGTITQYKRFISSVVWNPHSMGDPSMLKQVSESTLLFKTMNFTKAEAAYSSDLSPGFDTVPITGEGTGIWGGFAWGMATWGGSGSSRPYRTFIPRNKQRCRFINGRFKHSGAFEAYSIYGISYTYTSISNRGYR